VLALIAVLLLCALLFGVGFAAHVLWIIAAVVLVLWLIGFVARGRTPLVSLVISGAVPNSGQPLLSRP
jgi:hypothetical protein